MSETVVYQPRNDFCVLRIEYVGRLQKVAVPESSAEGKRYYVEAVGPKVEGMKVGDEVLAIGQPKVDWSYLPARSDLILTSQANVVLVIKRSGIYE